jgi:hypothetical protein
MGIGMLGPLVWFGGRAVVAMLIVMALSSVLALRGYRWAALTLFGLALSILALVVAALGYDAFIHKLPPFPPEMFRFWLAEQKRRVFHDWLGGRLVFDPGHSGVDRAVSPPAATGDRRGRPDESMG